MTFDYKQPDVPATAVADVVAEISGHGKLPELTPEQREQRRIENEMYLWQCQQRDEERQLEYKRRQAEIAAEADKQAAIVAAQEREQLRKASAERDALHRRDREVADLRLRTRQAESWQRNVERAAQNAIAYQQRQTIINELEAMLTPPPPPPEPEVVYVSGDEYGSPNIADENYNPGYWLQKPIFRR